MKKITLFLLAATIGFTMVSAKAKKEKTVEKEAVPAPLATANDTLNYISGMAYSNGLIPFLLQNKMDTAYMADFIAGFKEAVKYIDNPSKNAYIQGMEIAKTLNDRMMTNLQQELDGTTGSIDRERFVQGFIAGVLQDTTVSTLDDATSKATEMMGKLKAEKKERLYGKNREEGKAFLAENAKKEGVVTLPSGLQYKVLVKGEGSVPKDNQEVNVKYEGRLINGTVFDSSYKRNPQTTKFRPSQVIKGWTEALTMMPVGSTWELYIPENLAYGDREAGQIPPYSTLIFKVELVEIVGEKKEAQPAETVKPAEPAKKTAAKKSAAKGRRK